MPSQNSTQAANTTTAAEEISRFARYIEFRTRDLGASVANYLAPTPDPEQTLRERERQYEEDIFVDVKDVPDEEGWVGVTSVANEMPEARNSNNSTNPPFP
jgi:hypothetical protein